MKKKTLRIANEIVKAKGLAVYGMVIIEKQLESESMHPNNRLALEARHRKLKIKAQKLATAFAKL